MGVYRFMSSGPVTPEVARSHFEDDMAHRDQTFISLLEDHVYPVPHSPYLRLLRHAGIELDDVKAMVSQDGLDGALGRLYDAGVYVTQDEFKGRKPIIREGIQFDVKSADFQRDVSQEGAYITRQSSGTTGPSSEVRVNFDHLIERAVSLILTPYSQEASKRPVAYWYTGDLSTTLFIAKAGLVPEKYFSTRNPSWRPGAFKGTFLADYSWLLCRLSGRPIPRPEYVPLDRAEVVARWLAKKVKQGERPVLYAMTSPAIRVCHAAIDLGLDISGTLISAGGEALSPAKAELVSKVGATITTRYGLSELGHIALGCGNPRQADEVHLLSNRFGLVTRDKQPADGTVVPAVILTGLSAHTSKVAINLDTGDYATVEERHCGCLMDELGLTPNLTWIRSYEKLTSEGVTVMGEHVIELVEQILPGRFGGSVGDYQVVEEEEEGLTKVSLLISPRVGEVDEPAAIEAMMSKLSDSDRTGRYWPDLWRQGGTLRVVRREPYRTSTSKVMPLHVLHQSRTAPV
jgi:hypothetical protein